MSLYHGDHEDLCMPVDLIPVNDEVDCVIKSKNQVDDKGPHCVLEVACNNDEDNEEDSNQDDIEAESVGEAHDAPQEVNMDAPLEETVARDKHEERHGENGSCILMVPVRFVLVPVFVVNIQPHQVGVCFQFQPPAAQQRDMAVMATPGKSDVDNIRCEQYGQSCKVTYCFEASKMRKKNTILASPEFHVSQMDVRRSMKMQITPCGALNFIDAVGWVNVKVKTSDDSPHTLSMVCRGSVGRRPMGNSVRADFRSGILCVIPEQFDLWANMFSERVAVVLEFSPFFC